MTFTLEQLGIKERHIVKAQETCRKVAAENYVLHENGQYLSKLHLKIIENGKPWLSGQDALDVQKEDAPGLTFISIAPEVFDGLHSHGFSEFKYVDRGSTAVLLIGKKTEGDTALYKAVRLEEINRRDTKRAPLPINLLPDITLYDARERSIAEVSPLLFVFADSDFSDDYMYSRYVASEWSTILSDTGFTADHDIDAVLGYKDVAIAPDGTPFNVDRGHCCIGQKTEEELLRDIAIVEQRLMDLNLPAPFDWVDQMGNWKQCVIDLQQRINNPAPIAALKL